MVQIIFIIYMVAPWRKRLDARLITLGSRVRVSVTQYVFRGGRNGFWIDFSLNFSSFPLSQISFHHFICPCDGASGIIGRHPCYSLTLNKGGFISSHPLTRPCVGHKLRITYESHNIILVIVSRLKHADLKGQSLKTNSYITGNANEVGPS